MKKFRFLGEIFYIFEKACFRNDQDKINKHVSAFRRWAQSFEGMLITDTLPVSLVGLFKF